jgi:hypothetical protein
MCWFWLGCFRLCYVVRHGAELYGTSLRYAVLYCAALYGTRLHHACESSPGDVMHHLAMLTIRCKTEQGRVTLHQAVPGYTMRGGTVPSSAALFCAGQRNVTRHDATSCGIWSEDAALYDMVLTYGT